MEENKYNSALKKQLKHLKLIFLINLSLTQENIKYA